MWKGSAPTPTCSRLKGWYAFNSQAGESHVTTQRITKKNGLCLQLAYGLALTGWLWRTAPRSTWHTWQE